MQNLIVGVRDLNIPTDSFIQAGHAVTTRFVYDNKRDYESQIELLLGKPVPTRSVVEAKVLFGYLIQETVRMHNEGFVVHAEEGIEAARKKTDEFFKKNPWNDPVVIAQNELNEESSSSVAPKRVPRGSGGSKKDRCLFMYNAAEDKTPKVIIEMFMKELDLSKAGATTYEYNCRKGVWK